MHLRIFCFLGFVFNQLGHAIYLHNLGFKKVIANFWKANVPRSSSLKCVSNVVWETLSKARHVNENLAWEGKVGNEDEVFSTPPESLIKEKTSGSAMFSGQIHLEVNGVVHVYIVKQLINLYILHFVRSTTPNQSKSKSWLECVNGIKIGDKKPSPIPPWIWWLLGKESKLMANCKKWPKNIYI